MDRIEKQYVALSTLAEDYRKLLIKEFEREIEKKDSRYLSLRRAKNPKCRTDAFQSGVRGVTDDEIEIMELEKQIQRLCVKLNEPLPMPFQVLAEYVEGCKRIKVKQFELAMIKSRLDEPVRSAVFMGLVDTADMGGISGGEHQHLVKAILVKLRQK